MDDDLAQRARRIKDIEAKQRHLKLVHGWIGHYVPERDEDKPGRNFHTHGFDETWGHPDFQITMPLEPTVAHALFWILARRVKKGEKFETGIPYEGILGSGFITKFVEAKEDDRIVLRMLIPDKDGRLPGDDGCASAFEENQQ